MTLSQINVEQHIKIWVRSLGFDLMFEIFSYKLRKVSFPVGFSLMGLESSTTLSGEVEARSSRQGLAILV